MRNAAAQLGPGYLVAGRYRLDEQIGRGAMGIVWRGRDELLDRDVAVKQVQPAMPAAAADTAASRERTLREARSAARLSHPAVVTVFDVVEEADCPWIIMELVQARPLDQVIAEDGPLRPAQAARLGETLLGALATAHAAGVLHRDVKPSNVLMTPDGGAVLTDFGIATVDGDPDLTQAGMVIGTPGFCAPERVRGKPATPASDLWSLGATLYAAVEGRGPFDRAGGTAAVIAGIATEAAPRAPSAGPLAAAIETLLRTDPQQRPDSAAATQLLAEAAQAAGGAAAAERPLGAFPGHESTTATRAMASGAGPASADGAAGAASGAGPASADGAASAAAGYGVAASAGVVAGAATAHAMADLGEGEAAAAADAQPVAAAAAGLIAPPIFADLAMPGLADAAAQHPAGPGEPSVSGLADAPTQWPAGGPRRGGRFRNGPRVRIAAAAAAAALASAGLLTWVSFSALPGLTGGADKLPGAAASRGTGTGAPGGSGAPGAASPAPRGSHSPAAGPGGSGAPGQHGSSPADPAGSGSSNPSGSPSGSPTSSPSGSPTGQPPPPGFYWETVTAASIGTTAGYRIAVHDGWQTTGPAVVTTFAPAAGTPALTLNLTKFTRPGPWDQALYLQRRLAANSKDRYHLVSMNRTAFRGQAAVAWRYRFRPGGKGALANVTEMLFVWQTKAGPQCYAISLSARTAITGGLEPLFLAELHTFSVLP